MPLTLHCGAPASRRRGPPAAFRKGGVGQRNLRSIQLSATAIKAPRGVLAVAVVEVAAVQASALSFSAQRPVEFVSRFAGACTVTAS